MRAYVLIVERDLLTRETIIDLFKALGHLALGASSPIRGLKMLEAMTFDAIMISPGATSLGEPSYALDAKKLQPHVAVIMAAALELPEFSEPPIDAFIQKPFSLVLLEETLAKLFISGRTPDD
jgi:CheY-like chemotaxis protein